MFISAELYMIIVYGFENVFIVHVYCINSLIFELRSFYSVFLSPAHSGFHSGRKWEGLQQHADGRWFFPKALPGFLEIPPMIMLAAAL